MTHDKFRSLLKKSRQNAFKLLFDEYCDYVYAIVFNKLRSCGTKEDIDECTGDVFADIFRYYDSSAENHGDLSGFIGTVARRKAVNYFRKLTASAETVSIDTDAVLQLKSDSDIEYDTEKHEMQRKMLGIINSLDEPDRTIIIQKYYYNRTSAEISKMISMTPQSVRVRSSRIVRKLKTMLEKSGFSKEELI